MSSRESVRLEVVEALADLILDLTDDDGEIDEIAEDAARDMASLLLDALEFDVIGQDEDGVVTCSLSVPPRSAE